MMGEWQREEGHGQPVVVDAVEERPGVFGAGLAVYGIFMLARLLDVNSVDNACV